MRLTEAEAFVREHRETWAPGAKGYATTVFNFGHVVRHLGDIEVETIRPLHFAQLVKQLREEGKSPATINRIQSALGTVLNTLFRYELMDRKVPYQLLREPRGRLKLYTTDQLMQLMLACLKLPNDGQLMYDLVVVASRTGARQGELLKLTWEDVDFDEKTMVFRDTKTHEDRTLPLLGEVRDILERRFEERVDDGIVFPICKDQLLRRFRAAQRLCGIEDKDLCFHTLRHQTATELFARGASLPEVMACLGHKRSETSMRYSHATKQGIEKALQTLEN